MDQENFQSKKLRIEDLVRDLVEPAVGLEGVELVDVRYLRGPSGMILRLTIDKPGGVTIDDCANVSRLVGDILDVNDPIPGAYNLEVSSPGINRPLVRPADFVKFAGEKAYIKTSVPFNGRKRFKGVLKGMKEEKILIECQGEDYSIPLNDVAKARLDIL